jgi:hypothetical protein
VHVRVDGPGGEDPPVAGQHLGGRADDQIGVYARHGVRVPGLAQRHDPAVPDPHVRLHDAPVVEDQRIGDDGIDRALLVGDLALAHAVADHLAAAEFHLLAVGGEIFFHLDDEIGVGEADAVTFARPEHIRIDGAAYSRWHDFLRNKQSPMLSPNTFPPRRPTL